MTMKPLNRDEPGCNFTTSNCVIWQGEDIPCIKICKGDTVSDVVFKLATELCGVLDTLNINKYDISCLNLAGCAPANFHDFLQALINLICNLQDCCQAGNPAAPAAQDSFLSVQMPVNPFYYFVNEFGDTVTTMTGRQYLITVGNQSADTQTQLDSVTTTVAIHTNEISTLQVEVAAIPPPVNPLMVPVCVSPSIPSDLITVTQALEAQFCALRSATGTPTELFTAIAAQCVGLANLPTLGGGGGNMSSIPGWDVTLLNIAAAFNNLSLAYCDMRAAILNIQANCCPTGCSGITLNLIANLSGGDIIAYFSGVIPPGFANCTFAGILVTLTDTTGGLTTSYVDLVTALNAPAGTLIPIGPLNIASNINVHADVCLVNASTGANCSSVLDFLVVNAASCPAMTYIPLTNSIEYSGVSIAGTNSYNIQVWNLAGTVLVASQVQLITSPNPILGTFPGLTINTSYRLRVSVTPASGPVVDCPFEVVDLIPTTLVPLNLGVASTFVVLANANIDVLSGAPSAFIGDVGSNLGPIFGIAPGDVTGILYPVPADVNVLAAQSALVNAFTQASLLTGVVALPADNVTGSTITTGYWHIPGVGPLVNTGILTLDALGDPNAVFIIFCTGGISFGNASSVVLAGGAQWFNVFFVANNNIVFGSDIVSNGYLLTPNNFTGGFNNDIHGAILTQDRVSTVGPDSIHNNP